MPIQPLSQQFLKIEFIMETGPASAILTRLSAVTALERDLDVVWSRLVSMMKNDFKFFPL